MTYTLTRSKGLAASNHRTYFYKIFADDHMIDIKIEMQEPFTEEYLHDWFQKTIDEHRKPVDKITLFTKTYED